MATCTSFGKLPVLSTRCREVRECRFAVDAFACFADVAAAALPFDDACAVAGAGLLAGCWCRAGPAVRYLYGQQYPSLRLRVSKKLPSTLRILLPWWETDWSAIRSRPASRRQISSPLIL